MCRKVWKFYITKGGYRLCFVIVNVSAARLKGVSGGRCNRQSFLYALDFAVSSQVRKIKNQGGFV
jgi:hypothetical protein